MCVPDGWIPDGFQIIAANGFDQQTAAEFADPGSGSIMTSGRESVS